MTTPSAEKRALFVLTSRNLYGSELSLLPIVRSLDPSWKPYFLVEGAGPLDTLLRNDGFPVYRLDLGRSWQPSVRRNLLLFRLVYLLHSLRIQLVHVNLHFHAPLISSACSIVRIPIVVHVIT